MESFNELLARHDQEMKELMERQQVSWKALRDHYGDGDFPADVYQQWDQQYGNVRVHGLRAQHVAEAEAYPVDPREYRYENETPAQAEPEISTFAKMMQQQQRSHNLTDKLIPNVEAGEQPKKTAFEILEEQQKRQEQERKGFEPEP